MQLSSAEKWDHCIENTVRKTLIGIAIGGAVSLIFSRSVISRCAFACVGAGFGSGMAYGEARYLFDHNIAFDRRHAISVKLFQK